MPTALETAQLIHERYELLKASQEYSEADTIENIINPVLDYLGFAPPYRMRENQKDSNRPDMSLWSVLVALRKDAIAKAILEAKPLGHDLNGKGMSRLERPKEQLQRYVNGYEFSQPGTFGILTDGAIWHVVRKNDTEKRAPLVNEWEFFRETPEQTAQQIEQIKQLLEAYDQHPVTRQSRPNIKEAIHICEAIAEGKRPEEVLKLLTGVKEIYSNLRNEVQLPGKIGEAESNHWAEYAYTKTGRIRAKQKDLDQEAPCVAVVKATNAESKDDQFLYRQDVAVAAGCFAKAVPLKMSVVLMIQPDMDGSHRAVRLAVHYQGHTGMTAEFNPGIPSPRDLRTIQAVHSQLIKGTPITANSLTDLVGAKSVRKEFYEKIATEWALRQQRKARGTYRQRHLYREAVLRHLIRTIFAWILKEDGKLPSEPFDEGFARRTAPGKYHRDVLTFLFHERLNKPEAERSSHPNAEIDRAMEDTRFLNGSLFAKHQSDDVLELTDEDYFAVGSEQGLFTILNEYEWTASEHTPQSSEQTIDPEVLSNLFENLITATRYGQEVPDKMPEGTYYTPADIAQEMVKDALTEAVSDQAPTSWSNVDLRELFGNEDFQLPKAKDTEIKTLVDRIRGLTIFDPAVGSGEFPFLMMLAVKNGLRNLGVDESDSKLTRDIISCQIFAQDISPMAVQVTRLRLFIAIIAAETAEDARSTKEPLPNLEAKIICANTLSTAANRNWTPVGSGTLQSTIEEIRDSLTELASIRHRWQSAHDESTKRSIRREDGLARERLKGALKGKMANPETIEFARHSLLDPDAPPAKIDARLLFYDPDWTGFDIVIGNPPYEGINKDLALEPNASKERKIELARQKKERKEALVKRNYRTTAGNDLYNLIAEAALNLANPEGGVVALIVPLSICFGQDQRNTRQLFQSECVRIALRSQDNRPDKSFHDSPVQNAESRQRTTMLTARTGKSYSKIEISGANRWRRSERYEYLTSRETPLFRTKVGEINNKLDTQWERIPTKEIQALIDRMRECRLRVGDLRNLGENSFSIGFPPTAMYFITTTPSGELKRREGLIPISNEENLWLAMAAVNGHAGYAWWRTYGDAFHVNPYEMETIAVPDLWLEHQRTNLEAKNLGKGLIDAIIPENIGTNVTGTNSISQDSLNFFACAPDIIDAIDKLYLTALGLSEEPLLSQLHVLRSESTWRLGVQSID